MMNADWFRVNELDAQTFVLHEQRYWQANNCYLLVGREFALLFDSGSGRRDITPLVHSLTRLPVMVLCSHTHYDHVGNHARLAHHPDTRIVMPDLPATRWMMRGSSLDPPWKIRLAPGSRRFPVHGWRAPGDTIALGNRDVELVALPGHSADSVGIVDRDHGFVLVGDMIYNAPILAALPSASVPQYRRSVIRLLALRDDERLLCGHYSPEVDPSRLLELRSAADSALASTTRRRLRLPVTIRRRGRTTLVASRAALLRRF